MCVCVWVCEGEGSGEVWLGARDWTIFRNISNFSDIL